jgi:FixJ family two-component response regulator
MASVMNTSTGRTSRPPGRSATRGQGRKTVGAAGAAIVLVLDDDTSMCRSLRRLISAAGFQVLTFSKPSELLASEIPRSLPTILITGRTDAHTRAMAAQSEPVALLFKPFEEELLLDAIGRALALSTQSRG